MSHEFAGVLPIVHTPFLDEETIDESSLERQIDWAFEQGVSGFGTGMVTELLRLTARERIELTARLAELNRNRGVFFAGVGAESTRQALEYAPEAQRAGADAVMAIPPTTAALPAEELLGYFTALAEPLDVPLIVQLGRALGQSGRLEMFGRPEQMFDLSSRCSVLWQRQRGIGTEGGRGDQGQRNDTRQNGLTDHRLPPRRFNG